MPKVRDEQQYVEVQDAIKAIARQHMATEGTAALSLRAIARDLKMTAPALYRYFPSRDDLITALIVDAYNALADTLEAEAQRRQNDDAATRLYAILKRYRTWALEHRTEFELIYGNPIPGYVAPQEPTVAAAQRTFVVVVTILQEAFVAGTLQLLAAYTALPAHIEAHLRQMTADGGYEAEPVVAYIATVGWTRIHGIIMLELFSHIQPVIGDTEAFYRAEILHLLQSMGLNPQPTD